MTAVAPARALPTLKLKTLPPKLALPPKPKGPAITVPEWRPARTLPELRTQLAEIVIEVPPIFAGGAVVPLAIGVGSALVALARPECRRRLHRWVGAWCRRSEYLAQLAAAGSVRHDLAGQAVEPVSDAHRAHALQILINRGHAS